MVASAAGPTHYTSAYLGKIPGQGGTGIKICYTRDMKMASFPMMTTDWNSIAATEHPGVTGKALWRTLNFGEIRVRMVEYSAGYLADHWCSKGHILLWLEGELETELKDGKSFVLRPGMSYEVGDGDPPHRSATKLGARLFVVD